MEKTIINFKVDPKVKKEAQTAAKKLGLTLSDVLNVLLRKFARDKELCATLKPTPYLERILKESEEDIKAGRVVSFDNPKDALKYLDSIIEDGEEQDKN